MKRFVFWAIIFLMLSSVCYADEPATPSGQVEEKLYNFDDMLIDGEFRDPQGMFERARSESEFNGVLKLRRSFLQQVHQETKESTLKP